jgi:predicted flap endonuclease-1-like 5' DNA nuclease
MAITANLWALLGITLVIGFGFGLFVSNAGKYRKLWRVERRAREQVERERDTLVREHERVLQERDARIVALERTPAIDPASASARPGHAGTVPSKERDRLSAISGIDGTDETRLNDAGYYRYSQIAALNAEEERMLEAALHRDRGTIDRQQWRDQARMLADGRLDEHDRTFPATGRVI